MTKLLSYIGVGSVWIGFISLLVLFFYFGVNKKNYEKIIELYYEKGFLFYVPYHFHSLIGFWGSFTLVYYFSCLKKKKKPLFMFYENKKVYEFFEAVPEGISSWMSTYYKITIFTVFCIFITFVMACVKYVYSTFVI